MDKGIKAIAVSSVTMAKIFADQGFSDILIAFPVNILQIDEIIALAKRVKLHLMVHSTESAKFLAGHITGKVNVWIEIDTGYHRTGIPCEDWKEISAVAKVIKGCDKLNFEGLYVHAGNNYNHDKTGHQAVFDAVVGIMQKLKAKVIKQGMSTCKISYGDTPSCSTVAKWRGID